MTELFIKSLKIVKLLYEKGCKLEEDYYNESIERAIKKKDSFYLPQVYISKI